MNNYHLLTSIYNALMRNVRVIHGKGNIIIMNGTFCHNCRFVIYGNNNVVILNKLKAYKKSSFSKIEHCKITIKGSNNRITIGEHSRLVNLSLTIEDNSNSIILGNYLRVCGNTELAAIEGTNITIGDNCLFSANITFRTGDSHSIIDANSGKRINPSKDIFVGNHVWVGNTVIVLKKSVVGDNSIIGTGSVVTGKEYPSNAILVGNPSKVLKEGINWDIHRIQMEGKE